MTITKKYSDIEIFAIRLKDIFNRWSDITASHMIAIVAEMVELFNEYRGKVSLDELEMVADAIVEIKLKEGIINGIKR